MSLYYITGSSGVGKSTVLAHLKQLGYEAYDVDKAGPVTAKWHNKKTGYVHPKSTVKAEHRTPDFLQDHIWKVTYTEVEELKNQAINKNIFIGGNIANLDELKGLFVSIFALVVNNDVLKQRLQSRTNNDWGKSQHELQLALDWNKQAIASHKKKGHIIVDANQGLEKIVADIVRHINGNG